MRVPTGIGFLSFRAYLHEHYLTNYRGLNRCPREFHLHDYHRHRRRHDHRHQTL
jgi:hypothetical protein